MINTVLPVNIFKVKFNEDCLRLKLSVVFIFCLFVIPVSNIYGQVKNGRVDLRDIQFSDNVIELRGDWKFYWATFEKSSHHYLDPDCTIIVPGSWSKHKKYPVLGYGTYQLCIDLKSGQQPLAISFPVINSAYAIWINGKLSAEVGSLKVAAGQYKPSLQNSIVQLPDTSHVDVLIEVANFSYFSGGIVSVPLIGRTETLFQRRNQENGILNFLAGCLFAIFISQFALFIFYPRGKPYLWLSIICLIIALRSLIVHGGSLMLPELFPGIPTEIWKKIEFAGVYGLGALVALYTYHLYVKVAPKIPVYLLTSCSLMLIIIVLITPQHYYGTLLDLAHLAAIAGIAYSFFTIIRAKKAGYNEAIIILYGLIFSTPFFLLEIYINNTISRVSLSSSLNLFFPLEIGLLIFLGFQVYLLAQHYANSYSELSSINTALEQQVNERSKTLMETSLIKDKLLSIISHDVKTPINSLRGTLMLFNKGVLETKELKNLTTNIEEELNKTSLLIDDLLHWSKIQLNGDLINNEIFDLRNLIEDNIQLFKRTAEKKLLQFDYTIHSTVVCWDKHILNMVLRNLLANAIKFSHSSGKINIYVKREGYQVVIGVRDYGVGMNNNFSDALTKSFKLTSQLGTDGEKGNGIGLALANDYLTKAGGKLTCSSKINQGTEFLIHFSSAHMNN